MRLRMDWCADLLSSRCNLITLWRSKTKLSDGLSYKALTSNFADSAALVFFDGLVVSSFKEACKVDSYSLCFSFPAFHCVTRRCVHPDSGCTYNRGPQGDILKGENWLHGD